MINHSDHSDLSDQKDHTKNRFHKLLNNDNIRFYRFMEMIQYLLIYFIIGTIIGYILNKLYFPFNPKKGLLINYFELLLLLVIYTIVLFYILKLVKCVPLLFRNQSNFIPYLTKEYKIGGIVLILALCSRYKNLILIE